MSKITKNIKKSKKYTDIMNIGQFMLGMYQLMLNMLKNVNTTFKKSVACHICVIFGWNGKQCIYK